MFRAVPVPAGVHTVELEYRPCGFTAGAVLSALSALACVLLLVAGAHGHLPFVAPPEPSPV
jgi:uncharacterized membrane protein YfhO